MTMRMDKPFLVGMVCSAALLAGCTTCLCIDIENGDAFSYRYAPWEDACAEEAAARARYYWHGARDNYPTNVEHVLEIRLYRRGETNDVKRAVYRVTGKEA